MRRLLLLGISLLALPAHGDLKLRKQQSISGDFTVIGSTLGYDCRPSTPAPLVGTVGDCGTATSTGDSSLDVFWLSESPAGGMATADATVAPDQARTTAVLGLPAGAEVVYARLYWASRLAAPDTLVGLDRPGGMAFPVTADDTTQVTTEKPAWTQSTSDVTSTIKALGPGPIRFSAFASEDVRNKSLDTAFSGWALVVFYASAGATERNLAIFDGMALVSSSTPSVKGTITGFLVPNAGYDAKLGVVAWEGDTGAYGDALLFNNVALSDKLNPADNFFNGTRSWLGKAISDATLMPAWLQNAGDLPRLTGTAASELGIDIDVTDITARVKPGDQSASFELTTGMGSPSADKYAVGVFVTSISTMKPDFLTSSKSVTNLSGHAAVLPGDELEYTITVKNTGNDNSIGTVVEDPLPKDVAYKAGSIRVLDGPNMGQKTDAAGDDQAEYDAAKRKVVVRVGLGASAVSGGLVCGGTPAVCPAGGSTTTTIAFRVIVDARASGTIENQAQIVASGERGDPKNSYLTDGDSTAAGSNPTKVEIGAAPGDAAVPLDASVGGDATVPPDLARPDLTGVKLDLRAADLRQPRDMAAPEDMVEPVEDLAEPPADARRADLRKGDATTSDEEFKGGGWSCSLTGRPTGDGAFLLGLLALLGLGLRRGGARRRRGE